jgi:hypothetical protein
MLASQTWKRINGLCILLALNSAQTVIKPLSSGGHSLITPLDQHEIELNEKGKTVAGVL